MARIRSIKPDFFKDEDLATLTVIERLAFVGLWCCADKAGRMEYRPQYLKVEIFPYDPKIDMVPILDRLATTKPFIRIYSSENKKYIEIINFLKHQRPHHTEKESSFPSFNGVITVNSPSIDGEYPPVLKEEGKEEGKEDETKKSRFVRPTLQELVLYCTERKNTVDAQKFLDYYESNGWRVGKNSMKDWKAAVRTWEKNNYGSQNGGGGRPRESDRDRMYREGKELARKTLGYGGTSTRLFDNLYPDKTKRRADANLDSKIIDSTAVEVDDAG